jgi:hypothetical protein
MLHTIENEQDNNQHLMHPTIHTLTLTLAMHPPNLSYKAAFRSSAA